MADDPVVIDASALLALLYDEPGAATVAAVLGRACVSAANVAETYGRLLRDFDHPEEVRRDIEALPLTIHAFDAEQAFVAGSLERQTRRLGLSLGDRACLALARTLGTTVLTADRAWAKLDIGVRVELIR